MLDKDLLSLQEMRDLVNAAHEAQKVYGTYTQEQIDNVVNTVTRNLEKKAPELAKLAVEETGYGNVKDKTVKNLFATKYLREFIKDMKTVGIINDKKEEKVIEIGTPIGVVAGIVPSTNPTSTALYKAIVSLKSGNGAVLSPHPAAVKCTNKAIDMLNEELEKLGVPKGLIGCVKTCTYEATLGLMSHDKVSVILATGGSAMVKSAYQSGNPALGVGPGNVPCYIEKTADIKKAVSRIIASKTFDNGVICASEQAIVVEKDLAETVRNEFIAQNCYFANAEEKAMLEKVIVKKNGGLNPQIVGKKAVEIAKMAGVNVPANTKVILADETGVGKAYPFSIEKLSPLLGYYVVNNKEEVSSLCDELLDFGGVGHSLSIHTTDDNLIKEFALNKKVSRLVVNTPSSQGGVGGTTNLAPAFTLGCGAVGGSATSDNVTPMHLIDVKRVAHGVIEPEDLYVDVNNMDLGTSCNEVDEITEIVKRVLESYSKN